MPGQWRIFIKRATFNSLGTVLRNTTSTRSFNKHHGKGYCALGAVETAVGLRQGHALRGVRTSYREVKYLCERYDRPTQRPRST